MVYASCTAWKARRCGDLRCASMICDLTGFLGKGLDGGLRGISNVAVLGLAGE